MEKKMETNMEKRLVDGSNKRACGIYRLRDGVV